ncbi:M56 family metallopeptidase [Fusibacter sp. 3D3]|uniref:M56 family metallopeptidase n=1 Tax=Fusibacter sp. 3D3 TaxID=1048380 RepID=UPI000852BA60|nr:M56 family metallopeptidase [Fusibacter sp. 3D3]GAU78833.1 regulatory sensor-transducer [Fusibacter sp. 3D3]
MNAKLVLQVLELSITTSVIIGFLLLMGPQLQKRYRVEWRYVAWIVIAIRLLIPFKFTLPVTPVEIKVPEQGATVTVPYISDAASQKLIEVHSKTTSVSEFMPIASESSRMTLSFLEISSLIWLIGVCLFLFFQIGAYLFFLRKMQVSHKASVPEFIRETICEIGADMGISKLPEPIITDVVEAPVLLGILHPRILLPHTKFVKAEMSFILRHEMSHYRRKDMWYKLVLLLANALHWFNPLIYLMTAQAARDIELVCDYDVTRKMNCNERAQYANTILSALQGKGKVNTMFSTRFGSSKKDMKSRLSNLFDMNIKRRGIMVLCLLMLCTLLGTGIVSFTYVAPSAFMVDNEEPVTLELDYQLSQGKMAVWLVNPSGKIVYRGIQSTVDQRKRSYPGAKGLWSLITVADSKDKAIEGEISITLSSPVQTDPMQHLPQPNMSKTLLSDTNFSFERLGKHTLEEHNTLEINLQWTSKGYAILFYLDEDLEDHQILQLLQGLPNVPKLDEKDVNQSELNKTLNFSMYPESPVKRDVKVNGTDAGSYYFYLVSINMPDKMIGNISIQKTDATAVSIWTQRVKETLSVLREGASVSMPIVMITNNGGKNVIQSGSFQAESGQKLNLIVTSDIQGGSVDLFLFSPSGEEQQIVFSGANTTKIVDLSEGTWAYNATGFFQSGNIVITCAISE